MSNQPSTITPEVHLHDGKITTSSLNIAKVFDKPHRVVTKAIRGLEIPQEFSLHNFVQSDFKTERGKSYPMYEISRDGFTLLVMGFTGKKAMQFKLAYIAAFNQMESELYQPDDKTHDTAIMAECNQKMAEVESHYQSQLIVQQQQLIQMTSEAYQLAKEHIVLLKRGAATRRLSITYDMDSTRPDRFVKQVINALKLFPNLNKTQLLGECGYSKDDKTARHWLDAFEGEHWFCRKRSGVFTYNLSADELQGELRSKRECPGVMGELQASDAASQGALSC